MDGAAEKPSLFSTSAFSVSWDDLPVFALVFFTYFVTAKLGLYTYYNFHTSPALIWPPVGIALAAVIFRGYWMCVPIFLAQFLALITQPGHGYEISLISAAAYAAQSALALFVLRYFKFQASFDTLRNTCLLVCVAFGATLLEPMIITAAQASMGPLANPLFELARSWGAGIFSVLVFTPFIIVWSQKINYSLPERTKERVELVAAFAVLILVNYLLFWTPYAQLFGISVIFFVPVVLIWFALSFYPRWMTLALVLTSIQGIAGSILAHPSAGALNVQLVSDEVYIGFVAAIFLMFVTVVEERRDSYDRLRAAYRLTSASDQAKSDFIAILAHELRNPLAPIVSSLEWLRLQPLTQEAFEIVLSAQEHASMIRRLLDDLLDTARLTQRKLRLQMRDIGMRKIIEQSVVSTYEGIQKRQQKLAISMPPEDITVHADHVRLKQIIINLLLNASKYSGDNTNIKLSVARRGAEIVIRVADNGIGIAREKFLYIFEPFKQVRTAEQRDAGLGIGLFLAKNLTEMHGGRIEAESRGLGKGSTFSVYLPAPLQKAVEATVPVNKKHPQIEPQRILVVDDNQAAATALQRLLRHYGHDVATAFSGKEALKAFEEFQPEFILLDIGMPDIDGYTVARRIRATGSDAMIVALSGYGQESDKIQSREAGFDYHLVKPVNTQEILTLLVVATSSAVPV